MPPAKTKAADAAPGTGMRASARQPAAGRSRSPSRARAATAPLDFATFSEALGARPTEVTAPGDDKKTMRSFNLRVGEIERLKATLSMIQARTYGSDAEARMPRSLPELLEDMIAAGCTYWEDLLNGGQPARRIRQLRRGPSPQGAIEGAAKRKAARETRSR
jgi:hypothetical protein